MAGWGMLLAWLGGASLSWILCCLAIRRKGYVVRLGLGCLVLRARPGSRRFPHGVEVRVCTRLIGFLFSGGRGPWLDIFSDRFTMRLRAESQTQRWTSERRFLSLYLTVDRRYWCSLSRHLVQRMFLLFVRGLRLRASRVRIWKDEAEWEFSADTLVLAGCASGMFGSKYTLSVNELSFRLSVPVSEVSISVMCTRGIELAIFLAPRLLSLVLSDRHTVVDDLRFLMDGHDISVDAGSGAIRSTTKAVHFVMSPRHSRPRGFQAPTSLEQQNSRGVASLIHSWEAEFSVCDFLLRFSPRLVPSSHGITEEAGKLDLYSRVSLDWAVRNSRDNRHKFASWLFLRTNKSSSGLGSFMSVDDFRADAFGITENDIGIPAFSANFGLRGFCAGSQTAFHLYHSLLAQSARLDGNVCTKRPRTKPLFFDYPYGASIETTRYPFAGSRSIVEQFECILDAAPEILLLFEDVTGAVDSFMTASTRCELEVGSSGNVAAMEPLHFAAMVTDSVSYIRTLGLLSSFNERYSVVQEQNPGLCHSPREKTGSRVHVRNSSPRKFYYLAVNLRHCQFLQVNRDSVGDSDTLALIVCADILSFPKLEFSPYVCTAFEFEARALKLLHWSSCARTENLICDSFTVICSTSGMMLPWIKTLNVNGLFAEWDLDLQAALTSVVQLLKILSNWLAPYFSKILSPSRQSSENGLYTSSLKPSDSVVRFKGWRFCGSDLNMKSTFPDGPSLCLQIDVFHKFSFDSDCFSAEGCIIAISGSTVASLQHVSIRNPFCSVSLASSRPKMEIEANCCHSTLKHGVQIGSLIQDWLIRVKAVFRVLREEHPDDLSSRARDSQQKTFQDVVVRLNEFKLILEDHPLSSFLSNMIPLFQDECRDRLIRHSVMENRIQALVTNARSEIAGSTIRIWRRLNELDSLSWIRRVKKFKGQQEPRCVSVDVPLATVTAANLKIALLMDEETRHSGVSESLRKLRFLDEYQHGPRKRNLVRQYDTDVWNSIGFRDIRLDASSLLLTFRDYPEPFLKFDSLSFDRSIIGISQQATVSPYLTSTHVSLGRHRVAHIKKGLSNTKIFADVHAVVGEIFCNFNPAQLGAIGDFGRACSRFAPNGKNPSPRLPWFDILRVNCHGRMRISTETLKGTMTSSNSPYSKTRHFTNIFARNVHMVASRMKSNETEKYPISWELKNLHIRPNGAGSSDVGFEHVCVGLVPVPECNSGDAQDHYFIPLPSREAVRAGGPGIGSGSLEVSRACNHGAARLSLSGCYTTWMSELDRISDFDSYRDFKTRRLTLGVEIAIRHSASTNSELDYAPSRWDSRLQCRPLNRSSWIPEGASVLDSDGLSTLIKVMRILIRRPISCRLAPRIIDRARKPPSITGFSSSLVALNFVVSLRDLNLVLHNNVHPGHGLVVSVPSLVGVLAKQTSIIWNTRDEFTRDTRVIHRKVEARNLNASIRIPEMDLDGDCHGHGSLLRISRIFLSDDVKDEPEYAASPRLQAHSRAFSTGFGSSDQDRSPFYTFSASHAFQRMKKLDKVKFDLRIAVDDVRLLWSPARRISLWAWPDAFKEKSFCMKAPHDSNYESFQTIHSLSSKHENFSSGETSAESRPAVYRNELRTQLNPGTDRSTSLMRRPEGSLVDVLNDELRLHSECNESVQQLFSAETNVLETLPRFEFLVNSAQVCMGSPETAGLVYLTSDVARIGVVEKTVQQTRQIGFEMDKWTDKEYRVHLKESNVYCRTLDLKSNHLNFPSWLPLGTRTAHDLGPTTRVTMKPMSMDLVYIRSFSAAKNDSEKNDDLISRPSLLFINLRDISMASTSIEFRVVTDVVRKVLMQRNLSSVMVKDELAKLRYNLQLRNRKLTSGELDEKMRKLNTITKQFMYAADTSQEHLVDHLLLNGLSFDESLQRYKAQSKAVATFERTDQRASQADYQYPTMYVSYSFDHCGWELREIQELHDSPTPIVEISLSHLVCRHIFYVGRGSSTEITFKSIGAVNRMSRSHFEDFLKPAKLGADMSDGKGRSIKASDGASVAFRWYSTQTDKVGGIPIYDLLTVQVAPLNAAVSRRLYSAISKFIFPPRDDTSRVSNSSSSSSTVSSQEGRSNSQIGTGEFVKPMSLGDGSPSSRVSDVTLMAQRSQSTILFKYIFVDTFELTASFKNKELDRSFLDFSDLFVTTPSFSYSSEIWTWKDFANRIKRDLVYTFARRGVSNLAKIKFIPGYGRAKMKLLHGAESVQKSLLKRKDRPEDSLDSDNSNESGSNSSGTHDDLLPVRVRVDGGHKKFIVRALYGDRAAVIANELERIDCESMSSV